MNDRTRPIIVTAAIVAGVSFAGYTAAAALSGDDKSPDTPISDADIAAASAAALAHTGGGTVTDTEVGDEESYYEVEVTLDDGTQIDVQLDETFAVVGSETDPPQDDDSDDDDAPISDADIAAASAAALAHTGGGTVTDTEVGDEESYYEVEVTLDDGTQIDVQLDETFAVVGSKIDGTDDD